MAYRIRDWNRLFENNRTRELKHLDWVPVPNKMDGSGYNELVDHPNGAAHLGAWLAILEIASRQAVRGTIPQESAGRCGGISQEGATTCRCLSRMSRLPVSVFEEVIPRLLEIGWLESEEVPSNVRSVEIPQDDAEKCLSRAREGNRIEQKGIEHTHNARAPIAADMNGHTSQRFEEFWARWPRKQHRDAACRIWISVVCVEDEPVVFGCLDRFLASEQASRAIIPNPENWLLEQSRDRWQGEWPARAAPQQARRLSPLEELQQEARDAKRKA